MKQPVLCGDKLISILVVVNTSLIICVISLISYFSIFLYVMILIIKLFIRSSDYLHRTRPTTQYILCLSWFVMVYYSLFILYLHLCARVLPSSMIVWTTFSGESSATETDQHQHGVRKALIALIYINFVLIL